MATTITGSLFTSQNKNKLVANVMSMESENLMQVLLKEEKAKFNGE